MIYKRLSLSLNIKLKIKLLYDNYQLLKNSTDYKLEHFEGFSIATSFGKRDNLLQIIDNISLVLEQVVKNGNEKLLVDFRKVDFNFPMADAYNIVKMFELRLRDYQHVKIVVVCPEEHIEFGSFWKEIGEKRGFDFFVASEYEEAENWLEIKKASK